MVELGAFYLLRMNAWLLLRLARVEMAQNPAVLPIQDLQKGIFSTGGRWMFHWMQILQFNEKRTLQQGTNFAFYGVLKYAISGAVFLIALFFLWPLGWIYAPLSIVGFYVAEVQLMFLFPLLIDRSPAPLRESMAMTRKIGTIKAVWVILPIGIFMLLGLFHWKKPFKHWYLGCLAVVIWYILERKARNKYIKKGDLKPFKTSNHPVIKK
jgi:hypothetical protein